MYCKSFKPNEQEDNFLKLKCFVIVYGNSWQPIPTTTTFKYTPTPLPRIRPVQESIFCLICDYEKRDTQESELENSYTCTPLC